MFKVGDKVKRIVDVAPLKKGANYTVSAVDEDLWCIGVSEYAASNDATPFDINNFQFICSSGSSEQSFKQHIHEDEIVEDWLKKLQWLRNNDQHLSGLHPAELVLVTDFGDVCGADNVADYVNDQYDARMQVANAKRKEILLEELQEKEAEVAKLKAELASL